MSLTPAPADAPVALDAARATGKPSRRRLALMVAVGGIAVVAALAGSRAASATGPEPVRVAATAVFTVLTEPQDSMDPIPVVAQRFQVAADSTRHLGRVDSRDLYLGVDHTGHTICVLTPAESSSACAGPMTADGDVVLSWTNHTGRQVSVVTDAHRLADGWTRVGPNLVTR